MVNYNNSINNKYTNNNKININNNDSNTTKNMLTIFSQTDSEQYDNIDLLDSEKFSKDSLFQTKDNSGMEYIKKHFDIIYELFDYIEINPLITKEEALIQIKKLLSKINTENIFFILKIYKDNKINNTSLFEDIIKHKEFSNEFKLNSITNLKNTIIQFNEKYNIPAKDISIQFDKELKYQLKQKNPNSKNLESLIEKLNNRSEITPKELEKPNGKIDKPFEQGRTGNCWLISVIDALSSSPKGSEILNNTISLDQEGNAIVKLKGINKTYKITPDELANNTQYSTGDKDVRLIEIAFEKYFIEKKDDQHNINLNNDKSYVGFKILTGKDNGCKLVHSKDEWQNIFKEIESNPNFVATVASCLDENLSILTEDKNTHEIIEFTFKKKHGYAIKGIDEFNIIIADPNNSKIQYLIPKEPFMEFFTQIDSVNL